MILRRTRRKAFPGGKLEGDEWWRPWWDLDRLPQWLSVSYGSLHPSHTVRICSPSTSTRKTSEEPPATSGILRNKTRDSRFSRQLLWGSSSLEQQELLSLTKGKVGTDNVLSSGAALLSHGRMLQQWDMEVLGHVFVLHGRIGVRMFHQTLMVLKDAQLLEDLTYSLLYVWRAQVGRGQLGTLWLPCPNLQPAWRQGAGLW